MNPARRTLIPALSLPFTDFYFTFSVTVRVIIQCGIRNLSKLMCGSAQEGPLVLEPGPVFARDGDKNRSEQISYRILRGLDCILNQMRRSKWSQIYASIANVRKDAGFIFAQPWCWFTFLHQGTKEIFSRLTRTQETSPWLKPQTSSAR